MRKFIPCLSVVLCYLLVTSVSMAQAPAADPAVAVAPYVGAVLDTPDDWLLFGGEARLNFDGFAYDVNPRVTFNPYEGGSMMQIDINILHNYALAGESRFKPYVGIGGAFNRYTFDDFSDSAVGLNLVSGARLASPESRFEPFVNAQYTIIRGQGNLFTLVVGASITLR
jgi:hypothetical protein